MLIFLSGKLAHGSPLPGSGLLSPVTAASRGVVISATFVHPWVLGSAPAFEKTR